jgi:hypothetical protein
MKRSEHFLLAPILFMILMACNPSIQTTFKLKASDLTLAQGTSGSISVTVERDASDTTPIDLVLEQADGSALPAGLSGTFSPNPVTVGTGSLNIAASSSLAAKTYALQIKGSASGVSQTVAFNVIVETAKTFSLSIDPANLGVVQGQSGTVNVTLERTNFTDPIEVSLQGSGDTALPAGISATFTANATGGSFNIVVANTTAVKEHTLEVKAVGGGITKTTPLLLNVTAPPAVVDLALELNPSSLDVTQGQSGTVNVTLTRTNLTGDAVISLQGVGGAALPTGVTSAGATIAANTGSVNIAVAASVAVNSYALEVKAVAGSITKVKPLTLKVVALPASDFSIASLAPNKLSLEQGKSGSTVVNMTRNNLTADIVLSLQSQGGAGLPAGISAANVTVTGNSGTLSISTTAALAAKDYALEVKAVSGSIIKTTPFTLTVTAIPIPPDFTLSSDPTSLSLEQAKSGTTAVTIVRSASLTATIDVVLQGVSGAPLPTGISSSFVASSTGGTLTVNATAGAAVQTNTSLEIKAVGQGVTKTIPFKLTVTPKPDFTLATTTALTIEPTYSGDVGITLTRAGANGAVAVSLQGVSGANLPTGVTFTPLNLTGDTGTLVITVASNATAQTINLEVKAVGDGVTKTATISLTTLAAPFAINKATQTIIGWKPGELGDLLSATSDNPTLANYTASIDGTGLVSYDLPIPTVLSAPSSLLATYCPNTTNLTFSSSTVKGSERQFGGQNIPKTTYGSLVISNNPITSPPTVGLEQAFVVYVDGDINVTGTCQNSSGIIVNVNVNAQLKQGWNILVGKVTTVSGAAVPVVGVEVTSRTTVPARYAWRYYPR